MRRSFLIFRQFAIAGAMNVLISIKKITSYDGEFLCYIVAGYCIGSSNQSDSLVEKIRSYTKSELVFSHNNIIFFRDNSGSFATEVHEIISENLFNELQLNSTRYIFTFQKFSDSEYGVFQVGSGINIAAFYEVQTAVISILFLITFISFIIAFAASLFLSRKIVHPIVSMEKIVSRIEEGLFDEEMPIYSDDEIGHLALAFNNMSRQLEKTIERLHEEVEISSLKEKELKSIKKLLANIINSMPSLLICVDSDGRIMLWNSMAENLTGISEDEAVGTILNSVFPELLSQIHTLNKIPEIFKEEVFPKKTLDIQGKKRFFKITVYPLVTNGISGGVIRAEDTTVLEEQESLLIQAQKMETIGNLAGGIAHDFNNILAGIIGTLSILEFRISKNENIQLNDLSEHISLMNQAGKRAAGVIKQLLTFSRKNEKEFKALELNSFITNVLNFADRSLDKSVNIHFETFINQAFIQGDSIQLEQAILNLCINSVHAMTVMRPKGEQWGGELLIELRDLEENDKIYDILQVPHTIHFYKLIISDTGIGMSDEIASKIFMPFFTTKDKGVGTGLGLAMVYRIIESHGGYIRVFSQPGDGATFTILLPAITSPDLIIEDPDKMLVVTGKNETIMIVDDEIDVINVASQMVKIAGCVPLAVGNGEDAIKMYKEKYREISAVIMDLLMPGMTAIDLFTTLKEINPDIKVILSSGYKQDQRAEQLINAGIAGFLNKPYSLYDLVDVLRKVLVK